MDHCKWRKMINESNDQDGCEWVNVSSGTGPGQKAVKRKCVCVCYIIQWKLRQVTVWADAYRAKTPKC